MRMCRLFIISILWAFPLLATGCSDIIGDGIEELNYDDTTSSSSDSSGTGSGQTPSVNGGISGTPIPANNSADGASMTINSFDVNSTSITNGQSLNVHWNVSYSTPSLGYWTEFHLSSSPSQLSSQTQVFSRNGENNPFAAGKDETIPCSWQVGSTTSLNCTGYPPHLLTLPPPVYGVLRACTFGSLMESVCTQSAVQFSTQAPVGEIQVTALTATGNSAYMTIDRFDVTPTTIGNDRPTTISWGLKFKTPAARYTAEFHLNNGQQLQALSGRTRMFEDNGAIDTGMTGTDVSSTATIVCTRQTDQTGTLLNCGSHASAYIPADLTMPVYGILKACVDDADNRPVCAQKPLQLTFP